MACSNFLLFNQQVAPLTFIAELRAPHAPVGELEEHGRVRSAGRLDAPDCVIRFRCHTALPFIASGETSVLWACHICASRGDTGSRPSPSAFRLILPPDRWSCPDGFMTRRTCASLLNSRPSSRTCSFMRPPLNGLHVAGQTRSGDPTPWLCPTCQNLVHPCRTDVRYEFRTRVCCTDTWFRRRRVALQCRDRMQRGFHLVQIIDIYPVIQTGGSPGTRVVGLKPGISH